LSHVLWSAAITAATPEPPSVEALQRELEQMVEALKTRAVIEQAKGLLMVRYNVDEDAAFRILVRWSSLHNVKLWVVATTLVRMAVPALDAEASDSSNDPGLRAAIRHAIAGFDGMSQDP
jgi:hypothetical protein